jgi:hypothetical protein
MTQMKVHKTYIALGLIVAFTLFAELAAHADEINQATEITFNQAIHIPGRILPAGTYLFTLADTADSNVAQIFSADRSRLYATLQTISTESSQARGDTVVTLAKQGAGKPDLLLKWFYSGAETGHEFIYSNKVEKQVAQDRQQTVVANQEVITSSEADGSN